MNTCLVKIVCLSMDLTTSQVIFNYSSTPQRRLWEKTICWFWVSVIKSALISGATAKVGPHSMLRVLLQSLATNLKRPMQMGSQLLRQMRADFSLCQLIGAELHLTRLILAELHLTRLIGAELHLTRLIGTELHLTHIMLMERIPPRHPLQLGRDFLSNYLWNSIIGIE